MIKKELDIPPGRANQIMTPKSKPRGSIGFGVGLLNNSVMAPEQQSSVRIAN